MPSGSERATTNADLRPHPQSSSTYNEQWSYLFYFDNGTQAALNFSRADLGSRGPVCGADLTVMNLAGRDYRVARQYGLSSRWNYDERGPKLNVHPTIFFEGAPPRSHRVSFLTTKDDVTYRFEMTFSAMAPGITWGDGLFRLGSQRVGMFIHIPYARVQGTIEIDGVRQQVSGTAYMDHTFQTDFAPKLVRSAFRYVSHRSNAIEVGYVLRPDERYDDRPIGLVAQGTRQRLSLLKPSALSVVSTTRVRGADLPRQLSLRFDGGNQQVITREQGVYSFGALDELNALERQVARRFIGGEYVYEHGRASLGGGAPARYLYLVVK